MTELAQVQQHRRVLGWISPSVQTITIPPILIAKHTVAIYMCIDEYILAISTHLKYWRPQLYTEYPSHTGSLGSSLLAHVPTLPPPPGVLSSLEQTAWPRGEPGSSSECMDGIVRLCCASMCVQAEHRALFTAVCPFLTLAPFFMLTDFLWRETDRLDWHLKASFRLSYGLLKPCCKLY